MTWWIEWTRAAAHDLRHLDRQVARRVRMAVVQMGEAEAGDITRLTNARPPQWRLRVGDWRVLFAFEGENAVRVLRVLHRREAYR